MHISFTGRKHEKSGLQEGKGIKNTKLDLELLL